MEIDHVLIAVDDLAAAAEDMEARYGLASVEGGRHPGWGTANRIVPLGSAYLELIALVDAAELDKSPFGPWIRRSKSGTPFGWAVRVHQIEAEARRLGLSIKEGSRRASDGRVLRWQTAGAEQASKEPFLPFFIQWEATTPYPGESPIRHPAGMPKLAGLDLVGDTRRLQSWLDGRSLSIRIAEGESRVAAVWVRIHPHGSTELTVSSIGDQNRTPWPDS